MTLEPTYKQEYAEIIRTFISENVKQARTKGAVIGLSGGLDSATVAALCVGALGKENVLALLIPEHGTNPEDVKDAKELAENLGVEYRIIDISAPLKAFSEIIMGNIDRMSLGNIKARCRMVLLYHFARTLELLVMGTGNKSELLVGYFTKFGDGAADLLPLGDLYKTQVYELAGSLDIPEKILQKVPSAGLWQGQTDEGELGISYRDLDKILHGIELGLDESDIAAKTNLPLEEVRRMHEVVMANAHKRRTPLIPKLGVRTLGLDW